MKKLLAIILLMPTLIVATPETPIATAELMYERSDFVGVVTIVNGSHSEEGLRLKGKVELALKGTSKDIIEFEHLGYRWSDTPSTLGSKYLVFLSKTDNKLDTLNYQFSVIEVASISIKRGTYEDIWPAINISPEDAAKVDDLYWYPLTCINHHDESCELAKKIFNKTLKKDVNNNAF